MRTIKFRGRVYALDTWVYGGCDPTPQGFWITIPKNEVTFDNYRVVPETVGQFTGLLDMNGKEIYEDDIVDLDYILYDPWDDGKENLVPMRCAVEYGDFGFIFRKEEDLYYFFHDVKNIKVIGNIHDNPKLLKGGAQ